MAVKSIFEIEVKDEKFKEFLKAFNEFHVKLSQMSEHWEKFLSKDTSTKTKDAKALSDAVEVTNQKVKKTTESTKTLGDEFRKILNEFERAAPKIFKIIGSMLGPVGLPIIMGAGAALLIGKLFSMAQQKMYALGETAIAGQKSGRMLNTSAGGVRAFENDFGRLADPSMLQKIAEAQFDPEKQVYLMMASGSKSLAEVQKSTPEELSHKIIAHANQVMNTIPSAMKNTAGLTAFGFPQLGFTATDMNLWKNTPKGEIEKAYGDYTHDKKKLAISDSSADKFYEQNRLMNLSVGRKLSLQIDKFDDLAVSTGNLVNAFADAREKMYGMFKGYAWEDPDYAAPSSLKNSFTGVLDSFSKPWQPTAFDPTAEVKKNLSSFNMFEPRVTTPTAAATGSSVMAAPGKTIKSGAPNVNVMITNATGSNLVTSINGLSR